MLMVILGAAEPKNLGEIEAGYGNDGLLANSYPVGANLVVVAVPAVAAVVHLLPEIAFSRGDFIESRSGFDRGLVSFSCLFLAEVAIVASRHGVQVAVLYDSLPPRAVDG